MDYSRAMQIFQSKENIRVLHRNKPVWIESLSPGNETANVSSDEGNYNVPVRELVEG